VYPRFPFLISASVALDRSPPQRGVRGSPHSVVSSGTVERVDEIPLDRRAEIAAERRSMRGALVRSRHPRSRAPAPAEDEEPTRVVDFEQRDRRRPRDIYRTNRERVRRIVEPAPCSSTTASIAATTTARRSAPTVA
jgi:hypothetical protein